MADNKNNNPMKPMDVGAPVLIPQGNLSDTPGSYAWMSKLYWERKNGKKFDSKSSAHPGFKCGYYGKNPEYFKDIDMSCTMP